MTVPAFCETSSCPGMGFAITDDGTQIQLLSALPVTYDPSVHTPLFYDCTLNDGQGAYFVGRAGAAGPDVLYLTAHWGADDLTQRDNIANNTVILAAAAQTLTNPSAAHPIETMIVVDATAVFDGDDATANVKITVQYQIDSGGWGVAYEGNHSKDPLGSVTPPGYEHHAHFSGYGPTLAASAAESWEWRILATSLVGNVDVYAARLVVHVYGATI